MRVHFLFSMKVEPGTVADMNQTGVNGYDITKFTETQPEFDR